MKFYPGVRGNDALYAREEKKKQKALGSKLDLPKLSISKVNLEAVKVWLERRINELLGYEDDLLADFVINCLKEGDGGQEGNNTEVDAVKIAVIVEPFLDAEKTTIFMKELWSLLEEAQNADTGIPDIVKEEYSNILINRRKEEEERARKERLPNVSHRVIKHYIRQESKSHSSVKRRHADYSDRKSNNAKRQRYPISASPQKESSEKSLNGPSSPPRSPSTPSSSYSSSSPSSTTAGPL